MVTVTHLGSTAHYAVVRLGRELALLEVVEAPGLQPGAQFLVLRKAVGV
jgi:hypothetical protein